MGKCFSKERMVASYTIDIEASAQTIAKKIVDPAAIFKADHPKKIAKWIVIEPEKVFILDTKDGSELVEVIERTHDGMRTITRTTAGKPDAKTKQEVLAAPLFEVHELWEIESHPRKMGHMLLKKTWYNFEQKSNWCVPMLPFVRTVAAKDAAHLSKAWNK